MNNSIEQFVTLSSTLVPNQIEMVGISINLVGKEPSIDPEGNLWYNNIQYARKDVKDEWIVVPTNAIVKPEVEIKWSRACIPFHAILRISFAP